MSKIALIVASVAATLLGVRLLGQLTVATMIVPPDAEFPDGGRYYGDLKAGKLNGQGKLVWANGDVFVGEFVDGLMSGRGTHSYSTGAEYEGDFEEGHMSGQGTLRMEDGSVYEGQFVSGAFSGEGRMTYHNGDVYVGAFENNLPHGAGRYAFSKTGEWYKGEFERSSFSGRGIYVDKQGNRYEGEFRDWSFHGQGKYVTESGIYEGEFVDGNLTGEGRFEGPDGVHYQGGFVDWIYEGEGTLVQSNGDTYRGEFQYGMYEGSGTLVYAEPRDGVTEQSGTWTFGVLDGTEVDDAWLEAAMYSQSELLEETLRALAPAREGRIDMYFVGIAGWAAQDVFLKEVEFARTQFDESFGTSGRSLLLVNNPDTVAHVPLATVTGIGRTLTALADIMDPEDILFLFLTSHGSKSDGFALEHGELPLDDLAADQLGEMLRAADINWKVVVVSACFSGVFIEPVKDDRTLIMTAASADKESFGCSDDADMTYFGRAFFERSVPESESFISAFDQARELIHEWELDRGHHSEPQIHRPAAVLQQLARWRKQRAEL